MGLRIIKKDSVDYCAKLKTLRAMHIRMETKRWAAVTQRNSGDTVILKLLDYESMMPDSESQSLATNVKNTILDDHSDLKMIQGNLEINPALALLETEKAGQ